MLQLAELVKEVVNPKVEIVFMENTSDDPNRRQVATYNSRPHLNPTPTMIYAFPPRPHPHATPLLGFFEQFGTCLGDTHTLQLGTGNPHNQHASMLHATNSHVFVITCHSQ